MTEAGPNRKGKRRIKHLLILCFDNSQALAEQLFRGAADRDRILSANFA